eukprot:8839594-Pyramimonas_sp.AAC.2
MALASGPTRKTLLCFSLCPSWRRATPVEAAAVKRLACVATLRTLPSFESPPRSRCERTSLSSPIFQRGSRINCGKRLWSDSMNRVLPQLIGSLRAPSSEVTMSKLWIVLLMVVAGPPMVRVVRSSTTLRARQGRVSDAMRLSNVSINNFATPVAALQPAIIVPLGWLRRL